MWRGLGSSVDARCLAVGPAAGCGGIMRSPAAPASTHFPKVGMLSPATPRGTWDAKIALFEHAESCRRRWAISCLRGSFHSWLSVVSPFPVCAQRQLSGSDSRFQPMSKECAELYAQVSPQCLFLEVQKVFPHQNF